MTNRQYDTVKYDTVIWDLDGTLLDTAEDLRDAVNHVEQQYGYPQHDLATIKSFLGYGIEQLVASATPQGRENPRFAEIFADFKQYYTANCNHKTKLFDGIHKIVTELHQKGIKQAIVSNKNHQAVQELAAVYFQSEMDYAIGQQEKMAKKPAPDMVTHALARLQKDGSTAVYIGDSEVDVRTAENSGLPCIAVTWGFRSRDELEKAGAKVIVENPDELLERVLAP